MARDGLAWKGGATPRAPAEGMVCSVGINGHRPRQAIDPAAPDLPRPVRPGPAGPSLLDDEGDAGGFQVSVGQIDPGPDTATRPGGRFKL